MTGYCVKKADWGKDQNTLRRIREAVFVREQHVPVELEWDGLDPGCAHVIAYSENGQPIGTARLLADGHIGRMAVLKAWRGNGVGSMILQRLIEIAIDKGMQLIELNAQTHALGFYERHGFVPEGPEFDDAGIPHRRMIWRA